MVVIGTAADVPTVKVCQSLILWAGVEATCADGPDILSSAQDLAIGTL
jgi:hypothetical protein